MKILLALALACAILGFVPSTAAQGTGLTAEDATLASPVPYQGSAVVNVTVRVGCLTALATDDVTVTAVDPPAWLTVSAAPTAASPSADCVNASGTRQVQVPVTLTVAKEAPAVTPQSVNVTVNVSEEASDTAAITFEVAYFSDYTLEPQNVTFPLEVTNRTTVFQVVGTQRSNARSMIMVDGSLQASNGALVSGIASLQYLNEAGQPHSQTYNVTFTAPSGAWNNSTIKLRTFGHYNFNNMAGDPMDYKDFSWEIKNGGTEGDDEPEGGGGDGDKGLIPAPSGILTAFAIVALALLARRR